ncbi:MAG: hypothetical protein KI790_12900 [Cyclobacteriaceae bacterium]|nr:hypothetical protein [Cyclobacteriaceae bacterium HetDA_MAG_MS6]
MKKLKLLFISFLVVALVSCQEDDETQPASPADVIVINEGNFRSGDGTLSLYNSENDEVQFAAFAGTNGFPIAATIQNAIVYNDNIYAVTNASDKVEVIDEATLESVAVIKQGFLNPYSFAATGSKAFVTNWGTLNFDNFQYEGSFISIVDLTTHSVVDSIMWDHQPQHVLIAGDNLYVSNVNASSITVLNASNNAEVTDIETASGPDKMVLDANDDLWVLCTSGNLVQINTNDNTVSQTISGISGSGFNEKMTTNESRDKLYYLSSTGFAPSTSAVYEFSISGTEAPSSTLISGQNFHGVGVSSTGVIYVGDNNGFQGNGSVIRYDLAGVELGIFAAGRAPNSFLFR